MLLWSKYSIADIYDKCILVRDFWMLLWSKYSIADIYDKCILVWDFWMLLWSKYSISDTYMTNVYWYGTFGCYCGRNTV